MTRNKKLETKEFYKSMNSLDDFVSDIHANVEVKQLDAEEMVNILKFVGDKYKEEITEQKRENSHYWPIYSHEPISMEDQGIHAGCDVGYRLIRDQIDKDLVKEGMSKEERTLLLDSILGWSHYYSNYRREQEPLHNEKMAEALDNYLKTYGKERFKIYFEKVDFLFGRLHALAKYAEHYTFEQIKSQKLKIAPYQTFFKQSSDTTSYRRGKLIEKEIL